MTNFVSRGITLTVVAPYAVVSGAGFQVGKRFAVASFTAASGALVEGLTQGVVDLAKDASTFADGADVYWDNTAHDATSTVGSNIKIGLATLQKADGTVAPGGLTGDATVRVQILPLAQ